MMTLIREGGFPMWVILGLGIGALVTAFRAVLMPSQARLATARQLARATLYSTLVGVAAAFGAVFHHAPRIADAEKVELGRVVLQGLGESMSPLIMGFTILALVALFTAVAEKRHAPQPA
jgi:hypothetical protein